MNKKELYDFGIQHKPTGYELFKLYSPHAFVGSAGRNDTRHLDSKMRDNDKAILQKFYNRFPALNMMPQVTFAKYSFGDSAPQLQHPAITYLKKYKDLKRKGYSEAKAFEIVEGELTEIFEKQHDDMRLLRGAALEHNGDSYLDRA
jgi:hypothetical protein